MMTQFVTQKSRNTLSRREFLGTTGALCGSLLCGCAHLSELSATEPVIDIHQHTNYHARTDAELIMHQHQMGVTHTVLLPAGMFFGLEVDAGGNDTVVRLARRL